MRVKYFFSLPILLLQSVTNDGPYHTDPLKTLPYTYNAPDILIHNPKMATMASNMTYLIPKEALDNPSSDKLLTSIFSEVNLQEFTSYHPYFKELVGWQPNEYKLVYQNIESIVYQAGAWVFDTNDVWLTVTSNDGSVIDKPIQVLNLDSKEIRVPNMTQSITNPNGITYFNKLLYITSLGNITDPGGIYSVDPKTGETIAILNSYYGRQFNGINDLVWVYNLQTKQPYLYFTDASFNASHDGEKLPYAVWRFDPQSSILRPILNRHETLIPKAIAVNSNQTALYISEYSRPFVQDGINYIASSAIYSYDLDEDIVPVNRKFLTHAHRGSAASVKLDSFGYIWTCEHEAIVLRRFRDGLVMGEFNAAAIDKGLSSITNFVLATNQLLILAGNKIYIFKMKKTVMDPAGFQLPGSYNALNIHVATNMDNEDKPAEDDVFRHEP